jgi:hypothetical protein
VFSARGRPPGATRGGLRRFRASTVGRTGGGLGAGGVGGGWPRSWRYEARERRRKHDDGPDHAVTRDGASGGPPAGKRADLARYQSLFLAAITRAFHSRDDRILTGDRRNPVADLGERVPRAAQAAEVCSSTEGRSLNWQSTRLLPGGMRVIDLGFRRGNDSLASHGSPQARSVAAAHPALTR